MSKNLNDRYAAVCNNAGLSFEEVTVLQILVDKVTITFLKRFGVKTVGCAECKQYVSDEVHHHWARNYEQFNDIVEKLLDNKQFELFLDLIVDIYMDAVNN